MSTTQLSTTATPGRPHSFSPKGSASAHDGLFTELSTTATPGRRHSFTAKTSAGGHTGNFTELSNSALPGRRHIFIAKSPADVIASEDKRAGGYDFFASDLERIRKEDEEIFIIITSFLACL